MPDAKTTVGFARIGKGEALDISFPDNPAAGRAKTLVAAWYVTRHARG